MERIFKVFDFNIYNKKSDDNSSGDEDTKCRQDNNKFLIQMYGINEEGKSCSIIVENFKPRVIIGIGGGCVIDYAKLCSCIDNKEISKTGAYTYK